MSRIDLPSTAQIGFAIRPRASRWRGRSHGEAQTEAVLLHRLSDATPTYRTLMEISGYPPSGLPLRSAPGCKQADSLDQSARPVLLVGLVDVTEVAEDDLEFGGGGHVVVVTAGVKDFGHRLPLAFL